MKIKELKKNNETLQILDIEDIELVTGAACFGCRCICLDGWGNLVNIGGKSSSLACERDCYPGEMWSCGCP
jgi:hypothetical protein